MLHFGVMVVAWASVGVPQEVASTHELRPLPPVQVSVRLPLSLPGSAASADLRDWVLRAVRERLGVEPIGIPSAARDTCLIERSYAGPLACELIVASERQSEAGEYWLRASYSEEDGELGVRFAFVRLDGACFDPEEFPRSVTPSEEANLVLRSTKVADCLREGPRRVGSSEASVSQSLSAAELEELRPMTRALHPGWALGALRLNIDVPKTTALLEGTRIEVPGLSAEVRGLSVGSHLLRVEREGYLPSETTFEMPRTGDLRLDVSILESHQGGWDGLLWSGVAASALAGAAAVYGVVEADARSLGPYSNAGAIRLFRSSGTPVWDDELVGNGPVVAGLVAGLGTAGATAFVEALWLRDAGRSPWLESGIALVAGIAAYSLTSALTVGEPF